MPSRVGVIDWSQLITAEMKAAEALAERLAESKAQLATRNAMAAAQIDRITDRIETLGYGIEAGEATPEDEAEHASLLPSLKAWKTYKFALGKVTAQATWPTAPAWPIEPAIPEIAAAPMLAEESE
ncbi:tail fiber assembly protein [Pseudomonas chlororaphis subsp. aurantiaca]|uniref:tail fiber assembly protein n=1 Tax=Pseudomonas chlororaphis TaxID=587753 RepID=UPI00050D1B23|nr:tail fiber assembly protein [Pseudomonas chlororaphis]AIS15874.1 tail fiber assembly protein [Pseudomonas chlororaphis subsp. aurantiaca]